CKELELPGYNPYDGDGANPATLIGADLTDPISGSLPHRSYLCRVRPAKSASIRIDGGGLTDFVSR
ncbi:MAG: hypothetical protein HYU46_12920, partial [Deltaproteobacteria bacterium]|nr:hypothetical protein [Deltaproteobacteria bacterium]